MVRAEKTLCCSASEAWSWGLFIEQCECGWMCASWCAWVEECIVCVFVYVCAYACVCVCMCVCICTYVHACLLWPPIITLPCPLMSHQSLELWHQSPRWILLAEITVIGMQHPGGAAAGDGDTYIVPSNCLHTLWKSTFSFSSIFMTTISESIR